MKGILALAVLALTAAACGSGAYSPPATPTPAYVIQDCMGGETAIPDCATANAHRTPYPSPTRYASPTAPAATRTPAPAGASGVEGIVLVGPTCPVERADSPCPDRPVSVMLAAYVGAPAGGQIAGTAASGADGRFRMALAPGTYTLQRAPCPATGPGCTFPRITPQTVTVNEGTFTSVVVHGDTGIR